MRAFKANVPRQQDSFGEGTLTLAMHPMLGVLMLLTAGFLLAGGSLPPEPAMPPQTGNDSSRSRYLLLDSRIVEEKHNVRLAVGPIRKHEANPLFGEDKPWEQRFDNLYANVLYDDERKLYRCWYNPFIVDPLVSKTPREKRHQVPYRPYDREFGICYAVSKDGLKWTKPELNLVDFEGSKANNLLLRGVHGAGILKDSRDPQRRYKMFYGGNWIRKWKAGVAVRFSDDGLLWSEPVACPEVQANGDTHNNAWWAPELNRYVAMTRLYEGQRIVGRTESPDFLKWTKAVEVLRGDPENQTYAMEVFRYGRVYLGLVMIIRRSQDRVHCELTWSPDTIHWERIDPGTPFIPNSPIKGSYDWGCVYAANAPIVSGEEIRIYYGGSNGAHRDWRDGAFCLATLRPDGWAGYEPVAPGRRATVRTKPVTWRGGLRLTSDSAAGWVKVAVIDDQGKVLARSRPVEGSVTDGEVHFDGPNRLGDLAGRAVRLRFALRRAKLYSFVLTR